MKKNPLVSIVVTNFNYGKYLSRCLDSIFKQKYQEFEVIICDNASTDHSSIIANKFIDLHPTKIIYFKNRRNIGPAANFKFGDYFVSGDYIINFGADDVMHPDFLRKAVDLFNQYPSASLAVFHANKIDEDGIISPRAPFFDSSYLIQGKEFARLLTVASVTYHTSQSIWSTKQGYQIKEDSNFIVSPVVGERTNMFMHAVRNDIIYCHLPLLSCRESDFSETGKINNTLLQPIEQFIIINRFIEYAEINNIENILKFKDEAFNKIGDISLKFAKKYYKDNKSLSLKYLALYFAFLDTTEISSDTDHFDFFIKNLEKLKNEFINLTQEFTIERQHSYPPPINSISIDHL